MSQLPNHWISTLLEQVAVWGSGGTPSRSNPNYYGGDIAWIKTGELGCRLILSTEEAISDEGLKNSSAKVFPKGSIAIAMYGATIGKVSILGIDAATNQACAVGIPIRHLIHREYLYHFLNSQKDAFIKAAKGGAQPNISQAVIKEWKIPLPPLNEQKRIADKLDRILARVDACRERLDRIPVILKRFRQAVLTAATSGKLTEEWRENCSLPFNWLQVKLADVASSRLGKMLDKNKNQGELVPYLRNINVRWFDFNLDDIQKIRVSFKEKGDLDLRSGDVMICEGGEPGRCAVWRETASNFVYQKALHRVRVSEQLLPEYLCYMIKAAADDHSLAKLFTGTTIKHLTGISLNRFAFLLPPLQEQTEIVRRVEELFAYADRIEARYQAARARLDKLAPAILAKAFRGDLVPQNPDDEPASVLLERIRASRAADTVTSKSKRVRNGAAK